MEVMTLGRGRCPEMRQRLAKCFGGGGGDISLREQEYDKGMPKKGQVAFPPGVDMASKLRELSLERQRFFSMCAPEKRDQYIYAKEAKLVRIVIEHLPETYRGELRSLLAEVRLEMKLKALAGGAAVEDQNLEDMDVRNFSDDWLPSFQKTTDDVGQRPKVDAENECSKQGCWQQRRSSRHGDGDGKDGIGLFWMRSARAQARRPWVQEAKRNSPKRT